MSGGSDHIDWLMMVLLAMARTVNIVEVFENFPCNNIDIYGILKIGICTSGLILFVSVVYTHLTLPTTYRAPW